MSSTVRKATHEDLPSILIELKEFDKTYGTKKNLYRDDENTGKVIKDMIDNHAFFVSERDSKLTGFISGMFLPHMYNPDILTLVETFWWVKPEHRKGYAAALLLNEYVEFGKENADWVICTIEDDSPVNEDIFLKRGFKLKEKSFLLEVQ